LGLRKQSRQTPDEAALHLPLNDQLLLDRFDPGALPELPGLYMIEARCACGIFHPRSSR
jgi:hypothetical protein